VHILVATDADHVLDDVAAALGGPDVSFTVCRNGRDVAGVVEQRTPDLAVLDLQIGSMGGMAVTMSLRLDESAGRLPNVKVLMLLDRQADVHLAKRCAADGYLVKPLNPLSLKLAARKILAPPPEPSPAVVEESPEEVPATAG
jgi:two-component system nitrate/nitrite response regulator NarL